MKALIIEDETAAALNLEAILKQVAPGVEVIGTLESVEESIGWLRANPQPDLLFMDIHLADGDSFRIFDAVEVTAPVVFTTAYDQYALEAFRVNSIDYLLKPINNADVQRALGKLERLSKGERRDYGFRVRTMAAARHEQAFLVHVRDRIIPLRREQIAYCYTSNEKVTACTYEGVSYPLDKTLETLQAILPDADFCRANRQFIVARRADLALPLHQYCEPKVFRRTDNKNLNAMKKRIFAVAMTLCLLAGTSAFAQDRRAPRTKERPTAEQMAQRKTDRMVEKLNLNEDQSKQLYELNLQEVKDMQAQHERMRAARKAQAEKMQKILTPEQFEQWKQMQGPKPGMRPGPQMKDGKGCACKEGRKCDKPRPAKGRK